MRQANGPRRHARFRPWVLIPAICFLFLSFLSGVLLWWGEGFNDPMSELGPPGWYSSLFWLRVHGVMYPLVCMILGYTLFQHVRLGWATGANRVSGSLMLISLVGLVVSGAWMQYGGEGGRETWIWAHKICGVALPAVLLGHWLGAWRYVRTLSESQP